VKQGTEVNVVNFLLRSQNLIRDVPDDPDGDDPGPRAA
jgi:hypothetical protein